MDLYVIIGFLSLVLITSIWVVIKAVGAARSNERDRTRADSNEALAEAEAEARRIERELEDAWDGFNPTTQTVLAAPDPSKSAKIITNPNKTSVKSWLIWACLGLAMCTGLLGCARTVYVDRPVPVIPVGPALSDDWDCRTWEDYARRLRDVVDRFNEEFANGP